LHEINILSDKEELTSQRPVKKPEKSLGESCKKFLILFGAKNTGSTEKINVDDCISQLGIKRRRIYDIINILESFQMIKRLKKNEYEIRSAVCIFDMILEIEVSISYLI